MHGRACLFNFCSICSSEWTGKGELKNPLNQTRKGARGSVALMMRIRRYCSFCSLQGFDLYLRMTLMSNIFRKSMTTRTATPVPCSRGPRPQCWPRSAPAAALPSRPPCAASSPRGTPCRSSRGTAGRRQAE